MKPKNLTTEVLSSSVIKIHYKRPFFDSMIHITRSKDAMEVLKKYSDADSIDLKEHFYVLTLSNANRLLGISLISIGGTAGVCVGVKEILQLALLTNSTGIIIAHNHPSGILMPSQNDCEMTEKIKEGLSLVDINLLDHLVFTSDGYTSFADNGYL